MELKPHQSKAVDEIMAKNGISLVVAIPGAGKTFIAAGFMLRVLDSVKGQCLYVTMASAIKQQVEKLKYCGLNAGTSPSDEVYVISHERMRIDEKVLQSRQWSAVVCDEMHKVEQATKPTGKALVGDWRHDGLKPIFRLGLTATPHPNGLKDCFAYLKWLHPNCPWKSATAFRNECLQPHPRVEHTYLGVWPNKLELLSKMMADITVDVEYTPSYAKPIVHQISVTLSPEERTAYDQIKKNGIIELAGQEKVILDNLMVIDGKLRQFAGHPQSIGYALESSKEKALLDLLDKIKGKAIIFCQFRSVLQVLHDRHGWPMICGGVSMKKRNEILESEPDVLLMSSAGEASLDCQFATNVINYDLPWNEGRLDQRNGRSAREGQTEQVNIYYLTALDTADLHVKSVVMRKIKEAVKAKRTRT